LPLSATGFPAIHRADKAGTRISVVCWARAARSIKLLQYLFGIEGVGK
jgi:hypothetical protein